MKNNLSALPRLDVSCDSHVHTQLCGHAVGSMEEYVVAAISRGLNKITFLEHLEQGINSAEKMWLSEDEFDRYFEEGTKLKAQYASKIDIGLGVECGYNPDAKSDICKRLKQRQWDAIGISCHFLKVGDQERHVNLFSSKPANLELAQKIGPNRLISRYFSTLAEAVQELPGTKVCHLDGVLRFLPNLELQPDNHDQIEYLLNIIQKNKMALEVNTSGFAIRQMQFPATSILTRAISLKIPLVLGSDAHKPENVGNFFDRFS